MRNNIIHPGADKLTYEIRGIVKDAHFPLKPEDILFFNGLGDAIATIYSYLNGNSKIIGPNPAYSTHSSAEAAHSDSPHVTYVLDPLKNWLPDIEDLRNKIKYNPAISGILIINPDNPTGMVYPKAILEQIISIAREYDLFIISDEVYANVSYGDEKFVPIYELLGGDVPACVMRGLSKEIPWPGARCGWIEFHNRHADPVFAQYVESLFNAKMLQVCATTLPQLVIPKLFTDVRYPAHLEERAGLYNNRAQAAYSAFRKISGVIAPKPEGALYFSVVFQENILNDSQTLPLTGEVKEFIDEKTAGVSPDKRFVYYLMASTGICVVPLSGFNSNLYGFRMTLLEPDNETLEKLLTIITNSIQGYLKS